MSVPRGSHVATCALAACCAACTADRYQVPASGFLMDLEVETTVDSDLARYSLERGSPGVAIDPALETIIEQARAEVRGPERDAALARVARELSPDLSALLLAEALLADERGARIRRLYLEERERTAGARDAPVETGKYAVLFAPGWFYRSHPENGGGFERPIALAGGMGLRAERIETEENASVEHNARAIVQDVRRRAGTGRKLVLVSASKSGPEVALALALLPPDELTQVAAWVNIAGVLGGSPRVDSALVAPRCWAALALFGWRKWGLGAMKSMATPRRRTALAGISLPKHVLVVNFVPLPVSGQVSSRARGGYEDMRKTGPNDGLALTVGSEHSRPQEHAEDGSPW